MRLPSGARGREERSIRALVLALTTLAAASPAQAQQGLPPPRPRPEARIDYLGSNPQTVHAGVGLNVPVGTYVRVELVAAGGASWDDGRSAMSARADAIGRFAFDPFRERRWGLSAGGGLSARYDDRPTNGRRRWRALIALVVDLEGPRGGGVAPAFQVGLGGGVRAGVILRGADPIRR
jgi:hypothetical protein